MLGEELYSVVGNKTAPDTRVLVELPDGSYYNIVDSEEVWEGNTHFLFLKVEAAV